MGTQSILGRLDPAAIVMDPFPHVVVAEALAPDYYAALASAFPGMATIAGSAKLANNRAYRLPAPKALAHPAIAPVWREFVDYHCSDAYLRSWSGSGAWRSRASTRLRAPGRQAAPGPERARAGPRARESPTRRT